MRIELFDDFCRHIGTSYQPIPSDYLFFRYIGFHKTKLEMPKNLCAPALPILQKLKKENLSKDELASIDQELIKAHSSIKEHISAKLYSLISYFKQRIKVREVLLKIIYHMYSSLQLSMPTKSFLLVRHLKLLQNCTAQCPSPNSSSADPRQSPPQTMLSSVLSLEFWRYRVYLPADFRAVGWLLCSIYRQDLADVLTSDIGIYIFFSRRRHRL